MNHSSRAALALFAATTLAAGASIAWIGSASAAQPPAPTGKVPAGVPGSMRAMKRALRQLSQQIADPAKKDENLKLIQDMQHAALTAKGSKPETPLKAAKDAAAKAEVLAEFRGELIKLLHQLLDVEQALLEGDAARAEAALKKVPAIRDHAHEELGVEED